MARIFKLEGGHCRPKTGVGCNKNTQQTSTISIIVKHPGSKVSNPCKIEIEID